MCPRRILLDVWGTILRITACAIGTVEMAVQDDLETCKSLSGDEMGQPDSCLVQGTSKKLQIILQLCLPARTKKSNKSTLAIPAQFASCSDHLPHKEKQPVLYHTWVSKKASPGERWKLPPKILHP